MTLASVHSTRKASAVPNFVYLYEENRNQTPRNIHYIGQTSTFTLATHIVWYTNKSSHTKSLIRYSFTIGNPSGLKPKHLLQSVHWCTMKLDFSRRLFIWSVFFAPDAYFPRWPFCLNLFFGHFPYFPKFSWRFTFCRLLDRPCHSIGNDH